jgi:hypothetical protein
VKLEDVEKRIQGWINSTDEEEPQPSSAEKKESVVEAQAKPAPKPTGTGVKPVQGGVDLSMFSELQRKLEAQKKTHPSR